ncbi:hypothetical protein [Pleomorphomonas sp. JP5]|uniref:hypothetical protein n=1 Tax=Pleomorphomonas sp. JP5 TaxID=2942998 RepID=UPI002043C409|nr:hypothetical protein [Pleomorphomonas sp. JP5]MCM5556118.1 hypothetical protein [Pleomorphomonas sp. JP5]
MHLGLSDILLGISLDFDDDMTSEEIEAAIHDLGETLRASQSSVARVFVRPVQLAKNKEPAGSDIGAGSAD